MYYLIAKTDIKVCIVVFKVKGLILLTYGLVSKKKVFFLKVKNKNTILINFVVVTLIY